MSRTLKMTEPMRALLRELDDFIEWRRGAGGSARVALTAEQMMLFREMAERQARGAPAFAGLDIDGQGPRYRGLTLVDLSEVYEGGGRE